jgi:hypothetical protein
VVNGSSFDESDDPLVSAAAFELVQILARKGIAADEIRITFSSVSKASPATTVNIELLSLTETADIQPCFPGLHGVFALLDIDEEEAVHD